MTSKYAIKFEKTKENFKGDGFPLSLLQNSDSLKLKSRSCSFVDKDGRYYCFSQQLKYN